MVAPVKVPKPPIPNKREPITEPPKSPIPNGPIPTGLERQTMRYLIHNRWLDVYNNPGLLTDRTHRMDQSDIFYPMRKMLHSKGYNVESLGEGERRQKLYSYIKEYCEKMGLKRHDIGIFPADRAVMAYQGETYSVSFENYKQLAHLGVDVVCIEKEGIVEKLAPFAEGAGIALVQSQGFVSEYGIMLAQEAKSTKANVMVLTDFDADGVRIAFDIEGITRIGIDFDTIKEINKRIELELKGDEFAPAVTPVDEDESVYKPDMDDLDPPFGDIETLDFDELVESRGDSDFWKSLKYLTEGIKRKSVGNHKLIPVTGTPHEKLYIHYLLQKQSYDGIKTTNLEFLEENRIELNTIMTEIGAKRFWNWMYAKIVETFPTRDYTRVIQVPPYKITLPILDRLSSIVDMKIADCIQDERRVIMDELLQVRGLLNTGAKMDEIDGRLTEIVNEDEDITKFTRKLEKLVKSSFS